ncbi:TraB/GumN family protein [Shewanella sp.]|uniref:TraB/GumN family protein n=1 Tax=Shewanella sp. TaxID=50422 RepID=UPI003A97E24F
MSTTRKWWAFAAALGLFFSQTLWANESISPVFYQVQYQGKTAWLLGSFHVGKADFYPLPQQISAAYQQAEALVLEVDLRDPNMPKLVQQYGMQPQAIDSDTQAVLDKYCIDQPVCQQLAPLSPWLQAMQLSVMRLSQHGYSSEYGTETQLLKQLGQRPLLALETSESQFAMLAGLPVAVQWSMVRDAISAPDSDIDALVTAWQQGDAAALSQMTEAELREQGGEQMLNQVLWQRNQVMADGILQYLKQAKKPLFVAVGAAHLVGNHSVIKLLQDAGASSTDCQRQHCQLVD